MHNICDLPTTVFSILSLFFFRFHFHGLKILPKAWKRLLRSGGGAAGVLECKELDLTSPFLLTESVDIVNKECEKNRMFMAK